MRRVMVAAAVGGQFHAAFAGPALGDVLLGVALFDDANGGLHLEGF